MINDKDLKRIFIYGYDLIKLNINDTFKNDLEFYFRNDIKYLIDSSNYSKGTHYIKLTFIDKNLLPIFIIEINRNKETDECIYKSICKLIKKYKTTELFKHKEYEIIEK